MSKVKIIKVLNIDSDIKLKKWFLNYYPDVPLSLLQKKLRKGEIRVNSKKIKINHTLKTNDHIRIPPIKQDFTKIKRDEIIPPKVIDYNTKFLKKITLYEDENIIIINKPQGLATQGGSKIKTSIDSILKTLVSKKINFQPKLVHRLDKDTTGILVIAKNINTAQTLISQFKEREIKKNYLAIIIGKPNDKKGSINKKLFVSQTKTYVCENNGKEAITNYKILDTKELNINKNANTVSIKENEGNIYSLIDLSPETGRKHQLRAHMISMQTPILGDGKYAGKNAFTPIFPKVNLHLHAKKIRIPKNSFLSKDLIIEAPINENFKKTILALNIKKVI